jgi:hypothetical protein
MLWEEAMSQQWVRVFLDGESIWTGHFPSAPRVGEYLTRGEVRYRVIGVNWDLLKTDWVDLYVEVV